MMGGRNEQASYRRDGHSSIMAVHTSRRVSSSLTKRQHAFVVEEPLISVSTWISHSMTMLLSGPMLGLVKSP